MSIHCSIEEGSEIIENLYAELEEGFQKCMEEANDQSLIKSLDDAKKEAKKNFDEFIDEFYRHSPRNYYSPNGDMYNVLILDPMGTRSFNYNWDEGAMNQYERDHTGTLMEQTVGFGFHGGAIGTDKSGASVSTPHYRTPYRSYKSWGSVASSEEKSPYDQFMDWIKEYFNSDFKANRLQYFYDAVKELAPGYLRIG